jgi:hypothetical protein
MPRLPLPASQCLGLDALSQWESRARFSVGLGCPSFGGQRALCNGSVRLRASLVTDLKPPLPEQAPGRHSPSSILGGTLRESLRYHGYRAWR